ncbi:hypothetical protein EES46_26035 [Streptomyces sp. ADI98-10]|nr:hypothetical protein EES46_26035 [Streptomyces sp. ADI98-10]
MRKSATQQRFGALATKSRSTRSGARSAAGSTIVVITLLPRTAPVMPSSRMRRSTVQRATECACRFSSLSADGAGTSAGRGSVRNLGV